MKEWKEAFLYLAMGAMLIATGFLAVKETAFFVTSRQAEVKKTCVVIDAGHGKTDDRPKKSGLLRDCPK